MDTITWLRKKKPKINNVNETEIQELANITRINIPTKKSKNTSEKVMKEAINCITKNEEELDNVRMEDLDIPYMATRE